MFGVKSYLHNFYESLADREGFYLEEEEEWNGIVQPRRRRKCFLRYSVTNYYYYRALALETSNLPHQMNFTIYVYMEIMSSISIEYQ